MQQRAVSEKRNAFRGRRVLALLLALTLIFTFGSVTVLADDTTSDAGDGASASASPSPTPSTVPARPENQYVYDEADVLSDETEKAIVEKCKALDDSCGAELAVLTMNLMPGSTADERKAYAAQVVEEWNLGGESNNGLLLVFSISDEDYWLAPTENFQASFTLSVLKSLMNDAIETEFTNKNYDAAATNFVTAAAEKAEAFVRAQQLAAGASPTPEAGSETDGDSAKKEDKASGNVLLTILQGIGIVVLVVIGLGIVLIVVVYLHGRSVRRKRMEARRRRRPQGGTARPASRPRTSSRSADTHRRSQSTARPASRQDDDYRDFMNRYK